MLDLIVLITHLAVEQRNVLKNISKNSYKLSSTSVSLEAMLHIDLYLFFVEIINSSK